MVIPEALAAELRARAMDLTEAQSQGQSQSYPADLQAPQAGIDPGAAAAAAATTIESTTEQHAPEAVAAIPVCAPSSLPLPASKPKASPAKSRAGRTSTGDAAAAADSNKKSTSRTRLPATAASSSPGVPKKAAAMSPRAKYLAAMQLMPQIEGKEEPEEVREYLVDSPVKPLSSPAQRALAESHARIDRNLMPLLAGRQFSGYGYTTSTTSTVAVAGQKLTTKAMPVPVAVPEVRHSSNSTEADCTAATAVPRTLAYGHAVRTVWNSEYRPRAPAPPPQQVVPRQVKVKGPSRELKNLADTPRAWMRQATPPPSESYTTSCSTD